MAKIIVNETEITIINIEEKDYISLTDMVKGIDNGLALIEKWLRNKNTIEFLGIWEEIYNPDFNSPEFEGIKNSAGVNRFVLSVKQWIEKTNAVGIIAKSGRYGGTYAHKDIAFEFASWVSPHNIRDYASINQLICLSNMESLNSVLINKGLSQPERLKELNNVAIKQMAILENTVNRKLLK